MEALSGAFSVNNLLKLQMLEAVYWSPEGGLCQRMQFTNCTVAQPGIKCSHRDLFGHSGEVLVFYDTKQNFLQPFGHSHGGRAHFKIAFPTLCSDSLKTFRRSTPWH